MNDNRARSVAFVDIRLKRSFEELKSGKFEDKQLADEIKEAMDRLKENPLCGVKIESHLWPKEYISRYGINNLRKYDLRSGWRLMYTLFGDKVEIVAVLLEWLDHKGYERRFHYKSR